MKTFHRRDFGESLIKVFGILGIYTVGHSQWDNTKQGLNVMSAHRANSQKPQPCKISFNQLKMFRNPVRMPVIIQYYCNASLYNVQSFQWL